LPRPNVPEAGGRVDGPRVLGVVDRRVRQADAPRGVVLLTLRSGNQKAQGDVAGIIALRKNSQLKHSEK